MISNDKLLSDFKKLFNRYSVKKIKLEEFDSLLKEKLVILLSRDRIEYRPCYYYSNQFYRDYIETVFEINRNEKFYIFIYSNITMDMQTILVIELTLQSTHKSNEFRFDVKKAFSIKDKISDKYYYNIKDFIENFIIIKKEKEKIKMKNETIKEIYEYEKLNGLGNDIKDEFHSMSELYFNRLVLFSIICETYKENSWKSKLHSDGTMFKDFFIVGITTPQGDYAYHYQMKY